MSGASRYKDEYILYSLQLPNKIMIVITSLELKHNDLYSKKQSNS